MLDALSDPLNHPEFLPGLLAGAGALVAGVILAARQQPSPAAAGPLLLVSVLAGLAWTGQATWVLLAGLGLLAVAAVLVRRLRVTAAVMAIAGIALLTEGLGPGLSVWRLLVVAGGLALARALTTFDGSSPHAGSAPLLVLLTAGGIYATVPDTEAARVLLAASLPLAALAWTSGMRLGRGGALVLGGLLTWVIATGGVGRDGSVVGALAAAGLLLADPAARAVAGGSVLDGLKAGRTRTLVVLGALQLALSLTASRIAGLEETALAAGVVAGPLLLGTIAVLALGWRALRLRG